MHKNVVRGIFFVLFVIGAFVASQINFSALVGAPNQYFTVFQFFGPIAGFFLGPWVGATTVLGAQFLSFVSGKELNLLNVLRVLPMVFGAYYFGRFSSESGDWKRTWKSPLVWVPIACMVIFLADPVAREGWLFSLYWWIPVVAVLFFSSNALARALGATFAAHAIGSAIWAHTVPMTSEAWIQLIPIVAYERTLFAAGIFVTFALVHFALEKFEARFETGAIRLSNRPASSVPLGA